MLSGDSVAHMKVPARICAATLARVGGLLVIIDI